MHLMNIDHNKLAWKERTEIIKAINLTHNEKTIHRDLHSGNIFYLRCWNAL